jgi:protease-4
MKRLITAIIAIMCLMSFGCSVNVGMRKTNKPEEVVLSQKGGKEKILLLTIDGMISLEPQGSFLSKEPNMVASLREQLDMARKDEQVKGVIVRINSPGGTLGATQMIYDELEQYRKDSGAYILGLYLELAASGALYLSMASDYIMAYPAAVTGSMGVLFVSPNFDGLEKKVGVEYRVVKSGARKDMGTPFRNWPPEEQKMLEALANGYNDQFKNVVFSNRKAHGMSEKDFATLTDARIVSASEAQKLRLIDELGNLYMAIANVEKKIGHGRMKVIAYTRYPDEVKTLYSRTYGLGASAPALGESGVGQVAEGVVQTILQASSMSGAVLPKGFYYLW